MRKLRSLADLLIAMFSPIGVSGEICQLCRPRKSCAAAFTIFAIFKYHVRRITVNAA